MQKANASCPWPSSACLHFKASISFSALSISPLLLDPSGDSSAGSQLQLRGLAHANFCEASLRLQVSTKKLRFFCPSNIDLRIAMGFLILESIENRHVSLLLRLFLQLWLDGTLHDLLSDRDELSCLFPFQV